MPLDLELVGEQPFKLKEPPIFNNILSPPLIGTLNTRGDSWKSCITFPIKTFFFRSPLSITIFRSVIITLQLFKSRYD